MHSTIDIRARRPGNWFLDFLDGNYCLIVSIEQRTKVNTALKGVYEVHPGHLKAIKFTMDMPTLAGFQISEDGYQLNQENELSLRIDRTADGYCLIRTDDGECIDFAFVHEFQNAFFKLTGKENNMVLFGI